MSETAVVLPPQDMECEQSCLGAMLVEPGAAAFGMAYVSEDDFYPEHHRLIFAAIQRVFTAGSPVELITVSMDLRQRGELDRVGGPEYLMAISSLLYFPVKAWGQISPPSRFRP